jgi:hypothetical protein
VTGRGVAAGALLIAGVIAGGACAHAPRGSAADTATEVDSVTTGLWHMDETGGTHVADAGPFRLDAIAGLETQTAFGRDHNGRVLTRSADSFLLVPYNPALEFSGPITIEAWVLPASFTNAEDTPIAGRWTPLANGQSWLFTVVGRRFVGAAIPTSHQALLKSASIGHLMFAYQPDAASEAQSFFSSHAISLNRWTHVAVSFDGRVVRFYLDGLLDAQYATAGRIRHSEAPLLIGNFFDTRGLTDFGGDLRAGPSIDPNGYYAFDGMIDELRLSSAARTRFPVATSR